MDIKLMLLTWPSPAKINLFLYINKRRSDGYHELQTVFRFLNYCDKIKIKIRIDNKIKLHTLIPCIQKKNNMILNAAHTLKSYYKKYKNNNFNLGADIYLKKNIPIGGGLGGGSSNAATTLIALNFLWKTNLNKKKLFQLSLKLGADVPIFIKGCCCFAEGIGNKLTPLILPEKWYLILYPNTFISTKKIFDDLELKRNTKKQKINKLLCFPYKNDCEQTVRKRYPIVDKTFIWLSQYTTAYLTGTGSCVFAEFEKKTIAYDILNKIPKWIKGFVVKSTHYSPLYAYINMIYKKYNNLF